MPSPQFRHFRAPAVLGVAAFLAILPLLVRGPSCGHDFDFHLLSWLEAANQFAHFAYPHWAFTPAWNAGEPRFLFYPPLSWTLGAILGLILPWTAVPIAFTWVALFASGLTMHRLARQYTSSAAATLAATVYLANPYMLFTAYERTAYGELLAAAWLPLLFTAAFAQRVRIVPIAGAIALLWLTNAPAAVMGSYALAFLTAIRLARKSLETAKKFEVWQLDLKRQQGPPSELFRRPESPVTKRRFILIEIVPTAVTIAFAALLGLALAAFYIVPAAYEQRFVQVQMAVIPGMRVQDHFLFHRMAGHTFDDIFHDIVVRTASNIALTILAGIAIAFLFQLRKSAPHSSQSHRDEWEATNVNPLLPLALLAALIAFLLTPPSLFLWTHIPKLAFLQFPWRLTAILGVILALATALALKHLNSSTPYSLLPIPLSLLLILPAYHLFAQRCDREDTAPFRVALFHSNLGTEPTDEYTPIGADNDLLAQQPDPSSWLLPTPSAAPPPNAMPGQFHGPLMLALSVPQYLVINRRQYPHWQILLNGRKADPIHRKDGLIAIAVPQGASTVDLVWVRTFDQTIGLILSAIAALIALVIERKKLTAYSSQA